MNLIIKINLMAEDRIWNSTSEKLDIYDKIKEI